jgi:RNA ligase (TIGR02306 family)
MPAGLAYIGRIESLDPIPNADRIELATVVCGEGGRWSGVVKKGLHGVGQKCVAILQDAIVPAAPEYEFLAKSNYRVKMARLRGVPSECVIMEFDAMSVLGGLQVGVDVTEGLGITKYTKELSPSLSGVAAGNFPAFIPKTDEPNFQTAYRLVEALRGKPWVATVKCDGSSVTAYRRDGHFGVCSRNLELVESDCGAWLLAKRAHLTEVIPDGYALQFEMCGPGIQGNPLGCSTLHGFAFNVYDIAAQKHLSFSESRLVIPGLHNRPGLTWAPLAASGEDFSFTGDELRNLAEGKYASGKQREGIVIRPTVEEYVGQARLSFKVINLLYKD